MSPSLLERLRRFVCRWFGHRWHEERRADPVIPVFAICTRCGRWERLLPVRVAP